MARILLVLFATAVSMATAPCLAETLWQGKTPTAKVYRGWDTPQTSNCYPNVRRGPGGKVYYRSGGASRRRFSF